MLGCGVVTADKFMKTLSIVIPVFNESKRLQPTLNTIVNFKNPRGIVVEKFIFVNDGSTDATLSLLRKFKKEYGSKFASKAKLEIVSYKQNRGRGFASKSG